MKRACMYCGSEERELRPYGPGGRDVCHPCAMETPERKAQTKNAFARQLGMAGGVAVIDASEQAGPRRATDAERKLVHGR